MRSKSLVLCLSVAILPMLGRGGIAQTPLSASSSAQPSLSLLRISIRSATGVNANFIAFTRGGELYRAGRRPAKGEVVAATVARATPTVLFGSAVNGEIIVRSTSGGELLVEAESMAGPRRTLTARGPQITLNTNGSITAEEISR